MSDTARITDPAPSLTQDLVYWLADLHTWSRDHVALDCACGSTLDHHNRRSALMERKAELLARCRALESS